MILLNFFVLTQDSDWICGGYQGSEVEIINESDIPESGSELGDGVHDSSNSEATNHGAEEGECED